MIRFIEIPFIIRETMEDHVVMSDTELTAIIEADRWARKEAEKVIKEIKK
jgi:1-deoxy-D-xylulose 5-phosphate reductoisomerase